MNTSSKFTVIYSFKIVEGKEQEFTDYWTELTKLIYEFEGSYGSRLHPVNEHLFIAYAQWPDKATYDRSGNNLPETANTLRQKMRECCIAIKTEFELNSVVNDLLQEEQHRNFHPEN